MILIGNLVAGGIERQGIHDANALSAAGYDITLGFLKDGRYRSLVSSAVKLVDFSGSTYLSSLQKIFSYSRRSKIDIIVSHHVVLNLISVIAAKLSNCKCIVNEHGLSLNCKRRHIYMRRLTYFFADEVIAASKATLDVRHRREKLSPYRGIVVYNCFRGTKDADTNETVTSLTSEFHLPSDAVVMGTVTRMSRVKRVDLFVDLAHSLTSKHSNIYFFIIGDGLLTESVHAKLVKLGISDRVFLLGFKKNVNCFLCQFDMFALTSEIEANSLALLEALSMGLPCLAFDVGGNAEIISNDYNGYLAPFPKVEALSEYASLLINDVSLRNSLAINARSDAYQRFSPAARLSTMKDVISRICSLDRDVNI